MVRLAWAIEICVCVFLCMFSICIGFSNATSNMCAARMLESLFCTWGVQFYEIIIMSKKRASNQIYGMCMQRNGHSIGCVVMWSAACSKHTGFCVVYKNHQSLELTLFRPGAPAIHIHTHTQRH